MAADWLKLFRKGYALLAKYLLLFSLLVTGSGTYADDISVPVSDGKSDWVEDVPNLPSPVPKKPLETPRPGLDSLASDLLRNSVIGDFPKPRTISSDVYKRWFESAHGALKVEKDSIVVVRGACGSVLKLLGLPYTSVGSDLGSVNLNRARILFVNSELTPSALLSVRRFVGIGGSLITTDSALEAVELTPI